MTSLNEGQLARGTHRKRSGSPQQERVNTARPDLELFDSAMRLANASEPLPTSEAGFSIDDSPSLQRFLHERPEAVSRMRPSEHQVSLLPRPTSSGSLLQHQAFAWKAPQLKNPQVRIENPLEIPRHCQLEDVNENADTTDKSFPRHGKQRPLPASPSIGPRRRPGGCTADQTLDLPQKASFTAIQREKSPCSEAQSPSTVQAPKQKQQDDKAARVGSGARAGDVIGQPVLNSENLRFDDTTESPCSVMPQYTAPVSQTQKQSQTLHYSTIQAPDTLIGEQRASSLSTAAQPLKAARLEKPGQVAGDFEPPLRAGLDGPQKSVAGKDEYFTDSMATSKPLQMNKAIAAGYEALRRHQPNHKNQQIVFINGHRTPRTPQREGHPAAEKSFKVSKAPIRSNSVSAPAGRVNSATDHIAAPENRALQQSGGGPSEEDLLYLLMYQQRQRTETGNQLRTRCKVLHAANANLTQQNQQYQSRIEAELATQQTNSANLSSQKAALDDFKARFSKLKAFVNGLGKDYKSLREQGDKIKSSQQALVKEKVLFDKELQAVRTASTTAEQSVRSILLQTATVKSEVVPLEQSLHNSEEMLKTERGLRLEEQRRAQRLETHVVQLSNSQNRHNSKIQDKQMGILKQLSLITKKVTAVERITSTEPQSPHLPGLDECVSILKRLEDTDRVVPADVTKVTDAVTTLSQSLTSYQQSSFETVQTVNETYENIGNQLFAHVTTLFESSRSAPIEAEELKHLREERIRLEEQLKSRGEVMREVRECKTSAETREKYLQKTTDNLINEVKQLRNQSFSVQKPAPQVDEMSMISTWRMKHMSACEKVQSALDCINVKEEELRKRDEIINECKVQLQTIERERNAAVQDLNKANEMHSNHQQMCEDAKQKLVGKRSSIESSRLEIQPGNSNHLKDVEELKHLYENEKRYAEELQKVRSQCSDATKMHAREQEHVQRLQGRLAHFEEASQEAAKVPQLINDLQEKEAEIAELRQRTIHSEEFSQQISDLRQRLAEKVRDIGSLQSRLHQAQEAEKQIEAFEKNAQRTTEEVHTLKKQLQDAQRESWENASAQQALAKLESEMEALRKILFNAQKVSDQVPGLLKQVNDRSKRLDQVEKDLDVAKNKAQQLQDMEDANSHKDEEIASLSKRLSISEEECKELQDLRDANRRKEDELASMNERIRFAAESLKRVQDLESVNKDKDQELALLKEKLNSAQETFEQLNAARAENQLKDTKLAAMHERWMKFEHVSQEVLQSHRAAASQNHGLSQNTVLALQFLLTPEDAALLPDLSSEAAQTPQPAECSKHNVNGTEYVANQQTTPTTTVETSIVEILSPQNSAPRIQFTLADPNHDTQFAATEIPQTQVTSCVPDSQNSKTGTHENDNTASFLRSVREVAETSTNPWNKSIYFGEQRSATREIDAVGSPRKGSAIAYLGLAPRSMTDKSPVNYSSALRVSGRSEKVRQSSRPPSSYGETMLLEHLEGFENFEQYPSLHLEEQVTHKVHPQDLSISPELLLRRTRTKASESPRAELVSKKERSHGVVGLLAEYPSPRPLRSESQTRPKHSTGLHDRDPSDQNIPGTPRDGVLKEKHIPNSAVKRRLEMDEVNVPSSTMDSPKRLKRNLSALEVKPTGNKKKSSMNHEVSSTDGTNRLNHPSVPTRGRKGSIIGTKAPAPGAVQRTRKKVKSSKNDQYAARFGRDTS